ncbi:helix-turn-helix domain-containing protein [Lacticaseibacillus zhaodongensis]|uniref:helix-turn-helix domain-containing protein n=1 Tax=Lacticaseibacillus zhaodongensis TaxID=2668065 RepID=UPI0012D30BEC|nr:helix-turn-helix domain-containing protein [Lacticaseibacillus zhaodongensis]
MFESYFFDKHAGVKFRLFQLLKSLNGAGFTINKLSKTLGYSYQQTYNAFQDLMADLETMAGKVHTVTTDQDSEDGDKENDFAALATDIHVDSYRFYLLQDSITFRFFNTVFQNDGVDSKAFCAAENISSSTLRRRIEPFRIFLQEKQIRFDYATWAMQGTELQIRMLMNTFYTEAFRGAGWPFAEIDESKVKQLFSQINADSDKVGVAPVPFATKQLLVILGVQLLRIKQHKYFITNPRLQSITNHYSGYANNYSPSATLIFNKDHFPHLVDRVLQAELEYYRFIRSTLLASGTEDTATDRNLRTYFCSFSNPVATFVAQLMDALTSNLAPSSSLHIRADKILQSNFYRIGYTFFVLDGAFVKSSDFNDSAEVMAGGKPLYDKIYKFIDELPTSSAAHLYTRFLPDIAQSVFYALVPDLSDFETEPPLTIRVENENQSFISRDVFKFLSALSMVRVIPDDSDEQADVIITSAPNVSQMAAEMAGAKLKWKHTPTMIYWGNENEDSDLYRLMVELMDLAAAKVAAN